MHGEEWTYNMPSYIVDNHRNFAIKLAGGWTGTTSALENGSR